MLVERPRRIHFISDSPRLLPHSSHYVSATSNQPEGRGKGLKRARDKRTPTTLRSIISGFNRARTTTGHAYLGGLLDDESLHMRSKDGVGIYSRRTWALECFVTPNTYALCLHIALSKCEASRWRTLDEVCLHSDARREDIMHVIWMSETCQVHCRLYRTLKSIA